MEQTNTIGELAVAMPASIPVLERLGVDYCCHGDQTIQQACRDAGVTAEELLRLIESEKSPSDERTWSEEPLSELIEFIVSTHHAYTRRAVETICMLGEKVRDRHGAAHPEVVALERLIREIEKDVIPHMLKEEQILFPYVQALESALTSEDEPPVPFFGTVRNPIRMMMAEHETVAEKLAEVRVITNNYSTPADACTSFRALYTALQELEQDLHRHIHLENNVLFPRSLELESKSETEAVRRSV